MNQNQNQNQKRDAMRPCRQSGSPRLQLAAAACRVDVCRWWYVVEVEVEAEVVVVVIVVVVVVIIIIVAIASGGPLFSDRYVFQGLSMAVSVPDPILGRVGGMDIRAALARKLGSW